MICRLTALILGAAVLLPQADRRPVALVVSGGTVVTMEGGRVLAPGSVAIDGRDIALGTDEEYWQLLNGVTLWDVGVERTVEVSGPDADRLIDSITRRSQRPWRSASKPASAHGVSVHRRSGPRPRSR